MLPMMCVYVHLLIGFGLTEKRSQVYILEAVEATSILLGKARLKTSELKPRTARIWYIFPYVWRRV